MINEINFLQLITHEIFNNNNYVNIIRLVGLSFAILDNINNETILRVALFMPLMKEDLFSFLKSPSGINMSFILKK